MNKDRAKFLNLARSLVYARVVIGHLSYLRNIITEYYFGTRGDFTKSLLSLIILGPLPPPPDLGSRPRGGSFSAFFWSRSGWRGGEGERASSLILLLLFYPRSGPIRASFLFAWHNLKFMSSRIGYARLARSLGSLLPSPFAHPLSHPRRTAVVRSRHRIWILRLDQL